METLTLHLVLMAAEAVTISIMFLGLASLRRGLGLAPLYLAIGALQYLQVVLAASVYIEVLPGVLISPGSAVLFTGSLFAVLVTYTLEDVQGARRLIYALVIANVVLAVLSWMVSFHATGPDVHNFLSVPPEIFSRSLRVMVVGTFALYVDVVLLVVLYEALGAVLWRVPFARVLVSLWVVISIDSLLFVTGVFYGDPEFVSLLTSSISGKAVGAVVYAGVFALWVRRGHPMGGGPVQPGRVLGILTWRARYQELEGRLRTDTLTGLASREWLRERGDELLADDGEAALLVLDLDHFKNVNDTLGHAAGDEVLRLVGRIVRRELRDRDLPARVGGEELVVILPGAGPDAARGTAERLRTAIKKGLPESDGPLADVQVTVTIGVATRPRDGKDREELFAVADRRMYIGKRAGRDRVVVEG